MQIRSGIETHIVLRKNGDGTKSPITLEVCSLEECQADITWQVKGGFQPSNYEIVKVEDINQHKLSGSGWMEWAWSSFCKKIGYKNGQ